MRKSQTATEYLIILAVVIVIALVVVNTMGGFPGIGAGSGKKVSDLKLATETVGIESYNIGASSSTFKLKNNYYDTLTVTEFRVNQDSNLTCNSSNTVPALPIVLNVGQSIIVTCSVVNTSTYTLSSRQTPMVGVTYTDNIGATRTAGNEGSAVATSVSEEEVSPPVTPSSYTITFNANTGTGSMSTQTIQQGASANLIPNNFTKEGLSFSDWNTLANGSGLNYSDNISYTMGSANITLYAQWYAEFTYNGHRYQINPTVLAWPDIKYWGPTDVTTGINSTTDGFGNTNALALLGSAYEAATAVKALRDGGYSDWFIPASDELWAGYQALGETSFPRGSYMSSSEDTSYAPGWYYNYLDRWGNSMNVQYKNSPDYVLSVRIKN
jgi:hypothetical protein